MKSSVPVLGVLSILWLTLGGWWLSNMVCTGSNASTFSVMDGDFKTSSPDMYKFGFSSEKMTGYTTDMKKSFTAIGKHLKDNPDKMLLLTGAFGASEKNNTDYNNLGVARAESIKDRLVKSGATADQVETKGNLVNNLSFDKKGLMQSGVNFFFQNNGSNTTTTDASENSEEATGSATEFSADYPMLLNISSSDFDLDSYTGFDDYLTGLESYLDANPDKEVIIQAYNADASVGANISRRVRSYLKGKLASHADNIKRDRDIKGLDKSETGEPYVTLVLK